MPKTTFEGLDKILLDQPDFIDFDETEEKETDVEDKTSLESDDDNKDKNKSSKKKEIVEDNTIEIEEEEIDAKEKEDKSLVENKDKTSNTDTPTQEDLLKGWADYFKENTLLEDSDLQEFDGSAEGLTEAFKKREIRVGLEMVDDYKSQLPEMLKYLADNWEEGVPLNELLNIKSNQIRYGNLTDEKLKDSIDTQKAVYTEYLKKTTKYSTSKIEKEVSRLLDADELETESKEALKDLKTFEAEAEETIRRETKKEQEKRKEENSALIKKYEKLAKETNEIIPGLKLDEKAKTEMLKRTITPIGIDGNGNPVTYIQSIRNEDPHRFDLALNYFVELTKGLTDFSKITTSVTTKATKDLSKLIGTNAPKGNKDNIDTAGKKGILDYLALPQNKK